jgi:hypothetical protein
MRLVESPLNVAPIIQECVCVENIYFFFIRLLPSRGCIRLAHNQNKVNMYPESFEKTFEDSNEIL